MTKLSGKLGGKYQSRRQEIFTRQFELGGHTFKVRIPFVAESDEMYKRIMHPDPERIEAVYQEMVEPLMKHKDEKTEDVLFTENDIIVGNRSMRETAANKVIVETRITEYIKLLIPENPENSMDDITYQDIEAEFPFSVQLALVEKIADAISPTYKEARGN